MKMYDVRCPNCGRMNRNLLLDDSEGWMECEECGCISRPRRRDMERGYVIFPVKSEGKLSARDMGALKAV